MSDKLFISELYQSIQGEGAFAGFPCLFIRLTGCDLRCSWCDSEFSFQGGKHWTIEELVQWATQDDFKHIRFLEVTGGEPLLQKNAIELLKELIWKGKSILLETGGHHSIERVPVDVYCIVDVKCPSSGEHHKMCIDNYELLKIAAYKNNKSYPGTGELKFVVQDKNDFDYAVDVIRKHDLDDHGIPLTFSPVFGHAAPGEIADWIIESKMSSARLQVQLHKLCFTGKADFGFEGVKCVSTVNFRTGERT